MARLAVSTSVAVGRAANISERKTAMGEKGEKVGGSLWRAVAGQHPTRDYEGAVHGRTVGRWQTTPLAKNDANTRLSRWWRGARRKKRR